MRRFALGRAVLAVLLLVGLIGLAHPAAAHTRSESHSSWVVDGRFLHASFALSDLELKRLNAGGHAADASTLIAYLTPRFYPSVRGQPCRALRPGRPVAAKQGFHIVEFQWECPSASGIKLEDHALFDLVPTHIHFAQILRADGEFVEQLMTADQQSVDLESKGQAIGSAGFLRFVSMGFMHILTGVDHMSFLVGLVLISRRLRDLVFVVTGFTIGHSITLALAVTGLIRPHAEFIDALVALTIALIGAENVALAARRPAAVAISTGAALVGMVLLRFAGIGLLPPLLLIGAALFSASYIMVSGQLLDAGRIRLIVTLVFGLIHGFGFAADLLETRLPPQKLAEILVGFNLGVELGQLTFVLSIVGVVALLRRYRLTLPRPVTVDVCASALVAIGTYWFVSRSFA